MARRNLDPGAWAPPLPAALQHDPTAQEVDASAPDNAGRRRNDATEPPAVPATPVRLSGDSTWEWDRVSDCVWWSEWISAPYSGPQMQDAQPAAGQTTMERLYLRIHPDDRERVWANLDKAIDGADRFSVEFRFAWTEGGEYSTVISRGHVVRDADGVALRMFGAMQDTSALRHAQDVVRESVELSRTVLSSLSVELAVLDRDGTIVQMNDAWGAAQRANPNATFARAGPGENYLDVCARTPGNDLHTARAALEGIRAVLAGKETAFEVEYGYGPENERTWYVMHITPLRKGGGAVVAHIDITGRKLAEEMDIRTRTAEESERLKSNLINVVSHELRTPLAVIRGHVSAVLEYGDKFPPEQLRSSLQAANAAAQQLERLVGDLLTMGKLDAGMLRLSLQVEPVAALLAETAEGFRMMDRERPINVEILDEGLITEIDRARIIQVLYNVLDNATKYSPPQSPVSIQARREPPGSGSRCTTWGRACPRPSWRRSSSGFTARTTVSAQIPAAPGSGSPYQKASSRRTAAACGRVRRRAAAL